MHYSPKDGTWQIGEKAALISQLRERMTSDEYEAQKKALKEFLCGYFSSGNCTNTQGKSISPMKATPLGGKVLKVRWAYPGCGKSGSLRLVVVAYCEQLRVHMAGAFYRRDNPTDEDIRDVVANL